MMEEKFFFGIDDAGNIKGVQDIKQACLDIENKINDSISPQPNYTLEIQNNDKTIKLTIKSGVQTVSYTHLDVYKRQVLKGLVSVALAEQMQR